jgi:type IV pilus assembly protein PilF
MIKTLHYLLATCGLVSVLAACAPDPKPEFVAWSPVERAQTQVDLGFNYLQRDNIEVARESFKNAIEVNPKSSEAYHGLGLVEAKSLNLDLARSYLKRSVELDQNNIAAVSDYAIMLCQNGTARKGVDLLERNVKDLALLSTRLAFARCYHADGQIDRAVIAYKEVLAQNPNSTQALLSLAHLNYDSKSYLSASAFLQRYFYTNTISSDALLLAANVEHALDNPEERDYYTQQLWSRYPRSKQAIEARELYSK